MKLRKIILIILFSAATLTSAAENNAVQKSEITEKYESLDERVTSLENINNKFSTEYLISHYSTTFDHMSSIQDKLIAILGILSGLLAIAIPLITYIFGLRPMKEAEKRFNEAEQRFNAIDNKIEDKVKEKFDLYIKEKEYSKMNDALHNLTSIDPVLKQSAINYVIVNQDFIIDEYLASLIYHILEPNNTESTLRSALQTLLSSNDNIWAKKYFKKLYDIKDPCCYPNSDYVSKYLSRYYSKEISDFIISFSKDRFINFNYISTLFYDPFNLPGILPDYINDFLNNKEYIDLLDLTERSRFKNIIISYSNKYPFQYQETYLFTKHND